MIQIIIAIKLHNKKPELTNLPELHSDTVVAALSFGDAQAYFRIKGFEIQNAGDSFGRSTPLKDYDYSKLYKWLVLLNNLDNYSDFMPSVAGYYYSQTQYYPDNKYIVDFLILHSALYPDKKWWWLVQSIYLANHRLMDKNLALKLAYTLSKIPNTPIWAKQMPAFIHEQLGEKDEAMFIIKNILDNVQNIPEHELKFMYYFLNERLEKIIGSHKVK